MALTFPEPIVTATPETPEPFYALNNWSAGADPGVDDDETLGYREGSFWYRVVYPEGFWVCTDGAEGAAVWQPIAIAYYPDVITAVAGETIANASFVNLYNDSGTIKARKADATTNAKPCDGYSLIGVSSGQTIVIMTGKGKVLTGFTGLTVGAKYFLATTAGAITATPPSSSGNVVQRIGIALTSSTILFDRGATVEIA